MKWVQQIESREDVKTNQKPQAQLEIFPSFPTFRKVDPDPDFIPDLDFLFPGCYIEHLQRSFSSMSEGAVLLLKNDGSYPSFVLSSWRAILKEQK